MIGQAAIRQDLPVELARQGTQIRDFRRMRSRRGNRSLAASRIERASAARSSNRETFGDLARLRASPPSIRKRASAGAGSTMDPKFTKFRRITAPRAAG